MPSWGMHLNIAHKLTKKLNVDKNLFYFGNLLPDVDKGLMKRFETHYYKNSKLPNIEVFLKQNKIDNDIALGYLTHLLADYYYNSLTKQKYIYKKTKVTGIKLLDGKQIISDHKYILALKHHDFELYGKNIEKDILPLKYDENILKYSNKLKHYRLKEENIIKRINYLNNDFINENKQIKVNKYKVFSEEELDINKCVNFIIKQLRELNITT